MLRRWMQAYRAWDDRTYRRLVSSRWALVAALAICWGVLLILPCMYLQARVAIARDLSNVIVLFAVPVLIGVLVTIAVHRQLRRRQVEEWRRAGLCDRCGYDMRGSYYYCPECGKSFHR
jgi:hypothetical protein